MRGSLFLTKNSSVDEVFSLRKTFPASLKLVQEPSNNNNIKKLKILFIYLFFIKNSFTIKAIIPTVIKISATLKANQWKLL